MGLDSVELVLHTEEEFDIEIPDETAAAIRTVQQLCDSVVQLVEEQNNIALDRNETMEQVIDIVVMQLGVKRERVTPEARFVEDLKIDVAICPRFGI